VRCCPKIDADPLEVSANLFRGGLKEYCPQINADWNGSEFEVIIMVL